MNIDNERTSYNEVPYPSFVFPQTSPDRLSSIARLCGINSADPDNSRMLELGCGDGTNLLAFAYTYPNSRFVGIDLAERHIQDALRSAAELGLKNIEFIVGDLCELNTKDLGKFDLIVAHGLFSWVPEFVRDAAIRIYKECLLENGVGYLSYNVYPGCHIREMLSGMMRFHTEETPDPIEKVAEARSFIEFLADSVSENSIYGQTLRNELEQINSRSDSNVFHDDLSDFNQPYYFHEFISLMESRGLSYIAEANPSTANPDKLQPEVKKAIYEISDDPLVREQYIDFIDRRRFRSSLICLTEAEPLAEYDSSAIRGLRISSKLRPAELYDPNNTGSMRFSSSQGGLDINHPLTKAILYVLAESGISGMKYTELLDAAANLTGTKPIKADIEQSEGLLIRMFRAEFIGLHSGEPKFTTGISEKPVVSEFARFQASRNSNFVTTLAEANLNIENPFIAELLKLSDGTRTKAELAAELKERLNVPADEVEKFDEALPGMIDSALAEFAAAGLLAG